MAIKQNNAEGNGGATTEVNQVKGGTSASAESNKMMHASKEDSISGVNVDSGDVGDTAIESSIVINNAELSGCGSGPINSNMLSSTNDNDISDCNNYSLNSGVNGIDNNMNESNLSSTSSVVDVCGKSEGSGAASLTNKNTNTSLSWILRVIDILENNYHQDKKSGYMIKIYRTLILHMAHIPQVHQTAEDLNQFKEDIAKIGAFFAKANNEDIYRYYVKLVLQLITKGVDDEDGGSHENQPSCALAIIFQLFSAEMIMETVESLLQHNVSNKNIRKTVNLLCEWLRSCTFCQNLNLWIMAILNTLQQQERCSLFILIALDNVDQLFGSVVVPVLRPKVAPIVLHMLQTVYQTPGVFNKIISRFPRVIDILKQQQANISEQQQALTAKKLLLQLIDLAKYVTEHFYSFGDEYEPIKQCISDVELLLHCSKNMSTDFQNIDSACHTYPSSEHNYNRQVASGNIKCATTAAATVTAFSVEGETETKAILPTTKNNKMGLINVGNTCYVNSVLQALVMTKEFVREILLTQSSSPVINKVKREFALMLYSTRCELTPTRVLKVTRPPNFTQGAQQDSSEYLGHLLETLHEEEVIYSKNKPTTQNELIGNNNNNNINYNNGDDNVTSIQLEHNYGATALLTSNEHEHQQESQTTRAMESVKTTMNLTTISSSEVLNELTPAITSPQPLQQSEPSSESATSKDGTSFIKKIFTGQLATTYKCLTCGWRSRNDDCFRDLQLSFPEVDNNCASNYSVQDLIEFYCSSEKLEGDNQYFCRECQKLSDGERLINIVSAPKYLILTLKQFKYDNKCQVRAKLMHKVFHDEKVCVKVYSPSTLEEAFTAHYVLYAGIVHNGINMDSGHYYTYASDATNKWFKFNDSIVTASKIEELHNLIPPDTPYILFYEMGARSTEITSEEGHTTTIVTKIDVPRSLRLDELPSNLKEFIMQDNNKYSKDTKAHPRCKNTKINVVQSRTQTNHNIFDLCNDDDDDDDDEQQQSKRTSGRRKS